MTNNTRVTLLAGRRLPPCFASRGRTGLIALVLGLAFGLGACRAGGATPEARSPGELPGDKAAERATRPSATGPGAGAGIAAGAFPFVAEAAPVRALAAQGSVLWAASDRGLRRWELARGEVSSFDQEDGLPSTAVTAVAIEGTGAVWVATDRGVARLSGTGPKPAHFETLLPDPGTTHLTMGADTVFLAGARGLFRFDPQARRAVSLWSQGPVTALGRASNGGVCAAVAGAGVACFDEAGRPSLSADATRALTVGITFVGLAHEVGGTAVAAGTSSDGRARLLFLGARGAELYEGENMPAIQAVADGPSGPLLLVGEKGLARAYALRKVERGQVTAAGSFRFVPVQHKLEAPRYVAEPLAAQGAFVATAAVTARGKLYFGTETAGVVAAEDMKPLPGGELAEEERGLTALCENPERCVLATGGARAWSWVNHKIQPLTFGTPADGVLRVEGVWRGSEGASWALVAERGYRGFAVWRALGDLTRWEKVGRFPVVLPEGEAVARFVSAVPSRNIWVGLTGRAADGQEKSRGVLELEPGTWRTWHHHITAAPPASAGMRGRMSWARATQVKGTKAASPPKGDLGGPTSSEETLPVPDDIRAVWVSETNGQPATWFCTSDGVFRFLQGALRSWGENEGFENESCEGLAEGPDHAIWASTHAGLMRFDGKRWARHIAEAWPRDREGEPVAGYAVMSARAGSKGTPLPGSWVATARGLLMVGASASPVVLDTRRGFLDENLRALADDGEGRLWALGRAGITLVDPASLFATSSPTQP